MANLLQVSSAFGRTMESVDRTAMCQALYPVLAERKATDETALLNVVAASAEATRSRPTSTGTSPSAASPPRARPSSCVGPCPRTGTQRRWPASSPRTKPGAGRPGKAARAPGRAGTRRLPGRRHHRLVRQADLADPYAPHGADSRRCPGANGGSGTTGGSATTAGDDVGELTWRAHVVVLRSRAVGSGGPGASGCGAGGCDVRRRSRSSRKSGNAGPWRPRSRPVRKPG